MKLPILVTVVTLLTMVQVNAQENDKLTPENNDFSFEVNFYPNNPSAPIDLNYLRFRYFFNNRIALRMGFDFNRNKSHQEFVNDYYDNGERIVVSNDVEDTKYSVFGVHPGIEYHFGNMKRIVPYIAGEFFLISKSAEAEIKDFYVESIYVYPDAIYNVKSVTYKYTNSTGSFSDQAYTSVGFNILLGSDVYITKYLFLGLELGIGMLNRTNKEVMVEEDGEESVFIPESKSTTSGIVVNNAIRLGFVF